MVVPACFFEQKQRTSSLRRKRMFLVRRKGLEPPTYWFVASHSIQLSYRRIPRLTRLNIIARVLRKCKYFF